MSVVRIAGSFAVIALALCASGKPDKDEKEIVCKTCNDTGRTEAQCPVCRGTKYMWRCVQGKNKGWYSEGSTYRYDENGNYVRVRSDEGWCGYGATYKAIHSNCKNTRKRVVWPNCINKSRASASGKVTVECPDCDGQGTLAKTYYLVRDVRNVEYNREYILRQLERGRECSYVQRRKMTKDDLADYKIENSNCKVFEDEDELMAFLKNDEEQKAGAKGYFAIRDAKNVTMYDKRRALEGMANGSFYSYGDSNVLKRKFTDEEIKDFKALNPNCKLFRDVDEFKDFMRKVKAVAEGGSTVRRFEEGSGPVVVRRWSGDGEGNGSRIVVTNGTRRFYRTRSSSYSQEPQRQPQLSPEELKKIIDAENAHDKEMFERKFGTEGRNRVNNPIE